MHTPGLHAAACVLIAYLRPFVVNMLISQEGADKNYLSPSITSMGWAPYFTYVFVLTLFHHGYLSFPGMDEFRIFFVFYRKSYRDHRDQYDADSADGTFILSERKSSERIRFNLKPISGDACLQSIAQ